MGFKENDGRGARRQIQKKLILLSTGVVSALFTLWLARRQSGERALLSGAPAPSVALQRLRITNYKSNNHKGLPIIHGAVSPAAQQGITQRQLDQILSGELHLVEIRVEETELEAALTSAENVASYDGVYGTFCKLNWSLHKNDPSSYPMFRDLVANSPDCADYGRRIDNVNLQQISKQARQLDATGQGASAILNLTALVFHESRCGSTLTANLFAAYDPPRHRVYSESTPPLQALKQVCGEAYERCTSDQAALIFRDVVYMMSRSDDALEERVFFKIQSVGSRNIQVFQKAFPTTPYLFVYRDPVQVMMSHLKQGRRHANCVQQQKHPPEIVQAIVRRKRHNKKAAAQSLIAEDYCAAHLASITETVAESITKHGIPVNYEKLPAILYDFILPNLFGISAIPNNNLVRMKNVADVYSKGRGSKAGKFVQDSQAKEEAASDVVKNAAATFLQESYDTLEALAAKNQKIIDSVEML